LKLFIYKLFHWEYWPFQIVYVPIYFLWVFYGIKAKSIFFFNTCNPSIKNGGFMNESKKEIYDIIPPQYYPKTILISKNSKFEEVKNQTISNEISFPCIAKPDIGLRGSAVSKILNMEQLEEYSQRANFDYLVQDLIPFENEVGIFYVRFPNEKQGILTGIVAKEFLIVEGNGKSTMEALILENPRYALQFQSLKREYGKKLKTILPFGEKKNLVPFGNHARGAKFTDASNLISDKLTDVINEICIKIPEFYFGRLDVMYQNWADLENGKNFSLVEINGSGSEPTHIYDPKHSLFFAWKELARHITYMYQISVANNKRGFPYLSRKEGMKEYKLHLKQSEKIVSF
jgi:hypothetical protein